nr:MAG TPA: hypothetical protein [Caudoviricetes sp.]
MDRTRLLERLSTQNHLLINYTRLYEMLVKKEK